MEEGSNTTERAKQRAKRVDEMNKNAGYVEVRNTEANIKATWKSLSSRVKGLLGKKKISESKQRWPSLPDREISSDTEPDADLIPRYTVQGASGPGLEVEWVRPVMQCSDSEKATQELPPYPPLDEQEYGILHTTMAHKVNLELTKAYADSLREMAGNSALHVILQHDVGPKGKCGAFKKITLYNNTVSVVGSATPVRQILYQGRPTVPYDHVLKTACGEVTRFHPCGPELKCDELLERSRRRMTEDKNQLARLHRIMP